jgi:hypothetical protein
MARSRTLVLVVLAAGASAANLALPLVALAGLISALIVPMALVIAWLSTLEPRFHDDGDAVDAFDPLDLVVEPPTIPMPLPRPVRPPRS